MEIVHEGRTLTRVGWWPVYFSHSLRVRVLRVRVRISWNCTSLSHSPGWVLVQAVYLKLGFGLLQEGFGLAIDWDSA